MRAEFTMHPVHTVLHRPLLEHGVDVKYMLVAIGSGVLALNVGWLLLGGMSALGLAAAVGGTIYVGAKWATKREAQMFEILLLAWHDMRGGRLPKRYDQLMWEGHDD